MTTLSLPPPWTLRDLRGRLAVRADGVPYRRRLEAAIVGIAVHATPAPANAETLALYQTGKIEGDPYPEIAYHFVVGHEDGAVEWCHDLGVETWHAGVAGSATHLAVCFPGAGGDAPASPAQIAAGRALIAALETYLGRPLAVRPHHELLPVVGNRCPGPSWSAWGPALWP